MKNLPQTTVYLRVSRVSWAEALIEGEVEAKDWSWQFRWNFTQKRLFISPVVGRALIQEPLNRFLEASDFKLDPGSDHSFTVRSSF